MTSSEEAKEIAKEYLERAGLSDCEIIEVQDKIYKWIVKAKGSSGTSIVEVSQSSGAVIRFEKT
jgi:hypothetical protein